VSDAVYTTSVTYLGNGLFGVRVLRDSKVIMQNNKATSRKEAAVNLKECLRQVSKQGYNCKMAHASRARKIRRIVLPKGWDSI